MKIECEKQKGDYLLLEPSPGKEMKACVTVYEVREVAGDARQVRLGAPALRKLAQEAVNLAERIEAQRSAD